ncbi:MAG: methyltransferase domain-containing protein [Magnetococcales bacterium]|nr:methyltransferase domain-containing protein [Magnetococcales bacterium]
MKLNLGCGSRTLDGYLNVDKYGEPDLILDLEHLPWPWPDNSVESIFLSHVLEHLGADTDTYLNIFKEMYRVCQPNALIHIIVPHPRHDDFLNDPTHVRAVTPNGLALFSQKKNRQWQQMGAANTPLGQIIEVDFDLIETTMNLDPAWQKKLAEGQVTEEEIYHAERQYNNVVQSTQTILKAIKQ